ncbi:MAG: BACON domain-containing protein, partial [Akkermansiaceae bacterium]
WVTADVTQGTGSGVVNITVSENRSFNDRKAVIQIGGLDHQITQERRSAD